MNAFQRRLGARISPTRYGIWILSVIIMVMLVPGGSTRQQQIAARTGYLAGVLSKLGDTALWRRTLVIAFVIAVAFEIILFLINIINIEKIIKNNV